ERYPRVRPAATAFRSASKTRARTYQQLLCARRDERFGEIARRICIRIERSRVSVSETTCLESQHHRRDPMHRPQQSRWLFAAAAALPLAVPFVASASSHREAPFIAEHPKVDGTDFYMFRSYESGRSGYVTLIANYLPLQDAYGGPNYFTLDPEAIYDIHVDNDGDAREDLTFRFRFKNEIQ